MLAFEGSRRGLQKAVGSDKKGQNGEEEEERDHWIGWIGWNEDRDWDWDWDWDWDKRADVAGSDDVTGENGLHYWHYWSGRRMLNVGHSCYLGTMPWPIEILGSVYNRVRYA